MFVGGVVVLALASMRPMERSRRHPEDPRLHRVVTAAMGGVLAAVGAGLVLVGGRQRGRLVREGRVAPALVTGRWRGWRNEYWVSYAFVARLPDGTTPTVICRMSDQALYDRLVVGDTFMVWYVPSDCRIGKPVTGTPEPWPGPVTDRT
jgi:hypothetical protein